MIIGAILQDEMSFPVGLSIAELPNEYFPAFIDHGAIAIGPAQLN